VQSIYYSRGGLDDLMYMVLAQVFEQLRISLVTEQWLRDHIQKLVNAVAVRKQGNFFAV